jgi:DNA-binding response OmpR family regulator/two-component sensor histidine kinase
MKFYTNITHEFRTPLTLIMGPLEDIIEDLNQRSQYLIKNRLEKIYSHTERMLNLVNQLMTFRKIEAGHEPLIIQQVELNEFVSDLFDNFSELAIDLDIDYSLEKLNNSLNIWIDKEKIHKVLSNLLANAFKFTENGGNITLKLEEQIHSVAISVHDNGAGISEELHEKIFQRFYEKGIQKQNSLIKGSGVGLSLSKQLIELHHGKISVESQLHVGSVFTISVLKGKNHFKDSDFAKESEIKNLSKEQDNWSAVPKPQSSNNSGAQRSTIITYSHIKILIIDDNTEILDYIHSIFAEDYKIVTAKDGEEGLKKVKEHQPDIVITDLMMPNMDGMAFCRFVREDFEISHIPILMVTAKTFEDDMLKGLQTGANDYITKPFHSNELKYKVQNILEQRKRLVEHIQENNGLIRADVQVTSVDEDFLTNLIKLVEDNIDNPDFNIEQFSYELAVSRSLLFSKMKALTNSTPKNFVKSYRMKRAAQLLETQKLSISEIAYQVGFKDPNYFSKVFTKEYSVPPTTFISKIT